MSLLICLTATITTFFTSMTAMMLIIIMVSIHKNTILIMLMLATMHCLLAILAGTGSFQKNQGPQDGPQYTIL